MVSPDPNSSQLTPRSELLTPGLCWLKSHQLMLLLLPSGLWRGKLVLPPGSLPWASMAGLALTAPEPVPRVSPVSQKPSLRASPLPYSGFRAAPAFSCSHCFRRCAVQDLCMGMEVRTPHNATPAEWPQEYHFTPSLPHFPHPQARCYCLKTGLLEG